MSSLVEEGVDVVTENIMEAGGDFPLYMGSGRGGRGFPENNELYLMQSALRGEGCGAAVVPPSHGALTYPALRILSSTRSILMLLMWTLVLW